MLHDIKVSDSDYERASQLLGKLFEVDSDITYEISRYIKYNGITGFFRNIEAFNFPADVFEKLNAVRLVLFSLGDDSIIPEAMIDEMKAGEKL